MHRNVSN